MYSVYFQLRDLKCLKRLIGFIVLYIPASCHTYPSFFPDHSSSINNALLVPSEFIIISRIIPSWFILRFITIHIVRYLPSFFLVHFRFLKKRSEFNRIGLKYVIKQVNHISSWFDRLNGIGNTFNDRDCCLILWWFWVDLKGFTNLWEFLFDSEDG